MWQYMVVKLLGVEEIITKSFGKFRKSVGKVQDAS